MRMIRPEVAVVMEMLESVVSVRLGTHVEIEDWTQHCRQAEEDLNFFPENESKNKREGIAQAQEQIGGQDSDTKRNITPRLNLRLI